MCNNVPLNLVHFSDEASDRAEGDKRGDIKGEMLERLWLKRDQGREGCEGN